MYQFSFSNYFFGSTPLSKTRLIFNKRVGQVCDLHLRCECQPDTISVIILYDAFFLVKFVA